MKFKDLHPDYMNYSSDKYFYDHLPTEFFDAFQGLITAAANKTDFQSQTLRIACDVIANNIPTKSTSQSGYTLLIDELDSFVRKLKGKKLGGVLDTVVEVVYETKIDLDDLNDILDETSFGFELSWEKFDGYKWVTKEDTENKSESIEEGLQITSDKQVNVLEHLAQAKNHISNASSSRARKDALRDCLSALEAHYKYYTDKAKFEDAITSLYKDYNFPRAIVMDAKVIWNRIHDKTPDVRHGSQISSDLSEAEALYWIDRILALIKYVSRELEN